MKMFIYAGLACVLSSCNKNEIGPNLYDRDINASSSIADGINVIDGRLSFSTFDKFDQLISQSLETDDINKVKSITSRVPATQFISFAKDAAIGGFDESTNPTVFMSPRSTSRTPSLRPPGRSRTTRSSASEYDPSELIEDEIFSEIVNLDGELQIEKTFYKISPTGTIIADIDLAQNVYNYLDENDELKSDYFSNLALVNDDLGIYKLADRIFILDTYSIIRDYLSPVEAESGRSRSRAGAPTALRATGIRSASSRLRSMTGENEGRSSSRTSGGTSRTSAGSAAVNSSNPYDTMDEYTFNSKNTVGGKIWQTLFGDPHTRRFSTNQDRRIRVNFFSKNWGVFSSVGVNVKYQKKGPVFWSATSDFEEMRVGWSPMVTEIDAPKIISNPEVVKQYYPKGDPTSTAAKMLTQATVMLVKNSKENILILKLSSILDADRNLRFLSQDHKELIQTLINQGNVKLDYKNLFKKQVQSGYTSVFNAIKKQINYPSDKKIAFTGEYRMFIEDGFEFKTSGNGKLKQTFDWGTAYIGWRANPNSPSSGKLFVAGWAKTIKVISGSAYGAAKKNNEWAGIAVIKD
ncbi:hypothetical protein [Sphingobacterium paludis]|uniref:Uncharacterized protein n=1 Tax=Sphingobacterium paludis TaxID=1476465 RepID=A0A4R7D3E3_9SPHI|nr:hypothetical protein [Sphingobacterium paludis]TDS14957.1 hypothetical protein B0I21_103459 [Sphingobacterium paludis]